MTVVVTAVFHPSAGRREALIAALREAIPAVHAEDGCQLYAIHDAADGTVVMIEKWTDAAALSAHASGPAVAAMNTVVGPLVAAPADVLTMAPLPAGTPAQGAL